MFSISASVSTPVSLRSRSVSGVRSRGKYKPSKGGSAASGRSNEAKGPQMMAGPPKVLFTEVPARIFKGEAYHDPVKARRKEQRKKKAKQRSHCFAPTSAGHETFSGILPRVDPRTKPGKGQKKFPRNFLTAPAKKDQFFSTIRYKGGDKYDAQLQAERKASKASKSKRRGPPMKSTSGGGLFDQNVHKPAKVKGKRRAKSAAPKNNPTIPFRPGGTGAESFSPFTYKSDKYGRKASKDKRPLLHGTWNATSGGHTGPIKSVLAMNATRGTRSSRV